MQSQNKITLEKSLVKERKENLRLNSQLKNKETQLLAINKQLTAANTKLKRLKPSNKQKGDFESIIEAYILLDLNRNILDISTAALAILEVVTSDEILTLNDFIPSNEKENVETAYKELQEHKVLSKFKLKIKTPNKTIKLVNINANLITDEQGKHLAYQAIVKDITKETKRKNLLIASENRLKTLVQTF
jgi:two-component system, sporulation sensor kinase E